MQFVAFWLSKLFFAYLGVSVACDFRAQIVALIPQYHGAGCGISNNLRVILIQSSFQQTQCSGR